MTEITAPAPAALPIRLRDYQPPEFLIDTVDLVFHLGIDATRVVSRLAVRRNLAVPRRSAELRLDGQELALRAISLDGEELGSNRYRLDDEGLVIVDIPDEFVLDIETENGPAANTRLSGLYASGGNLTTQCEPEGFRRITYFIDRPDVMSRYTTTIIGDEGQFPVLLSNGNPVDQGRTEDGRHWAKWVDPHPKPSYLFALVAGKLVPVKDSFTTRSGRDIALAIWVRHGDEDRCGHAMTALKAAMRWDEAVFGLEYDLEVFNIVAVGDFNMGAMENKGLNIFNTAYVLAKPATATDTDYQNIERVVAHEYFHNWTGNRVTCRDWFQLSLKEGLTVFRDQEFMSDQHSRAVKRIADVRLLRARQFSEDASPLAHPVRPDSYLEIDNFYTPTVYEKGAELVRMIHTLIGAEAFRRGMDLYFQRHDNSAVTVEDFVAAMATASGRNLAPFLAWYTQAGTPEIRIEDRYEPAQQRYHVTFQQRTKPTLGQETKVALPIPVALGLVAGDGRALAFRLPGETATSAATRIIEFAEAEQTFQFDAVAEPPVPSFLRGFSAPVKLDGVPLDRLKVLAAHDSDPFARWDALQRVATQGLLEMASAWRRGERLTLDPDLVAAFERTLAGRETDLAFAAEAMLLPSEPSLADQMPVIDVDAIHAARSFARGEIARALHRELVETYEALTDPGPYRLDGSAMGSRALRNLCLGYLAAEQTEEATSRVAAQFDSSTNMTDVLAALSLLNELDDPRREAALDRFHAVWHDDDLVIDKWFALRASSPLPSVLDEVEDLARDPEFDRRNPNRVRALISPFCRANPVRFHDGSGRGYRFLVDQVLLLDPLNPLMAAKLVQPLGDWRRYDKVRAGLMRQALETVLAAPSLSKNTLEMVSKSLA